MHFSAIKKYVFFLLRGLVYPRLARSETLRGGTINSRPYVPVRSLFFLLVFGLMVWGESPVVLADSLRSRDVLG